MNGDDFWLPVILGGLIGVGWTFYRQGRKIFGGSVIVAALALSALNVLAHAKKYGLI